MEKVIKEAANLFLERAKDREIRIVSHHDTDGITSASIMARTLAKLDKKFSVKIVKGLEKDSLDAIMPKKKEILMLLDLGSSCLNELSKFDTDIFIIDHHEITSVHEKNIVFVNPHLLGWEEISASGLTYLFCREIFPDEELAKLGVVGMVGDMLDKEISKLNNKVIEDAEVVVKRGLMLYPATRPIHKTLEFSSFYIPGVTGNPKGVQGLLKEIGIDRVNGEYKSLIELTEEELSRLLTAVLLRTNLQGERVIGNIYLIKLFNKLEDARELSAMINACSRLGYSYIALALCLGNKKAVKEAESIYAEYKQHLVSALNFADQNKMEGKGYILLNAKDRIKDTLIGTVASIMSMSKNHEAGTVIVTMAYDNDKVKISARICGREGRNVRELLSSSISSFGGDCGGHPAAAGCLISKEKETEFLENLIKNMEMQVIQV